jgi:hypothetical protein
MRAAVPPTQNSLGARVKAPIIEKLSTLPASWTQRTHKNNAPGHRLFDEI